MPIGRPIANTTIYVVDPDGNPAPKGVPGELYVGGIGVARGYVNRSALTAERFVPDPFSSVPGARLYRTGDRARHLEGGDIEFLGRIDHQVKIRGFRIEPGEIEARLKSHDAVMDAVVVARGDDGSDKRLVAYVTALDPSNPPGPPELRAHVGRSLPDHMIPAHFVVLDELPVTPNGKVDRAALPAPEGRTGLDAGYAAPRTPAEEVLAEIWCEVLGIERASIHDDFFELGGHSLVAGQVVSHANKRGFDLAIRDVFEHPTLIALARYAESGSAEEYDWESPITFNEAGDREAVMLVNPVNVTTPYWYADLARALGTRHPSFALQPLRGGRSARRLMTIEEMAEKCIADLTGLWPERPYVVGGWSLGGLVAWEVAGRLHSGGRAPKALVLIDPPGPAREDEDAGTRVQDVDAWGREVVSVLDDTSGASIRDGRRQLLASLFEEGGIPGYYLDLPVSDLVRFVEGYRISAWAQERYDLPRYQGDVVLFMSGASDEAAAERAAKWRARVDGGLVAYATGGSHHALLLDQQAGALASAITSYVQGSSEALEPSPLLQPVAKQDT